MAFDVEATFIEMVIDLDMTYEECKSCKDLK